MASPIPESIDLGEVGSHLSFDGADVLVQDRTRGRLRLLRVTRTVRSARCWAATSRSRGTLSLRADRGIRELSESFGELVVIEGREVRALTAFGAAAREAGIVVPVEHEVAGRDGYPVHGWVACPRARGRSR